MSIPCSICGGQPCREGCWDRTARRVERHMEDPMIQGFARSFADFRTPAQCDAPILPTGRPCVLPKGHKTVHRTARP